MMRAWISALLFIILLSCVESAQPGHNTPEIEKGEDPYAIKRYNYDSLTIPAFFERLLVNHVNDFLYIDKEKFAGFCEQYGLNSSDSVNSLNYFTVNVLHDLFTCENASNCSQGPVLKIPYQWHWVDPNPRHSIYFVADGSLLKDSKPPMESRKYRTYADVDRTPYFFLTDLVSERPKYYSASCDTFSTFGWCSEREMAFVSLIKLLGLEGKIVTEDNHSWSELIVPLNSVSGNQLNFKVLVDNTFNRIKWEQINNMDIDSWKLQFGKGTGYLPKWYNEKAGSAKELEKIKNHHVGLQAAVRIEESLVKYLEKRLP